jgi:hypothetical protein
MMSMMIACSNPACNVYMQRGRNGDTDEQLVARWNAAPRHANAADQGAAKPYPAPACWRRCKWADAEQHRSRILTGSIGLEGAWSEWIEGKPEKTAMNREYEYRTAKTGLSGKE